MLQKQTIYCFTYPKAQWTLGLLALVPTIAILWMLLHDKPWQHGYSGLLGTVVLVGLGLAFSGLGFYVGLYLKQHSVSLFEDRIEIKNVIRRTVIDRIDIRKISYGFIKQMIRNTRRLSLMRPGFVIHTPTAEYLVDATLRDRDSNVIISAILAAEFCNKMDAQAVKMSRTAVGRTVTR